MGSIPCREKMRAAVGIGFRKALRSYLWLLKILLPISLATALLDYAGWLHQLDFVLEPMMAILSLPAAAALPILIGMTAGVYASIAAMAVLPFSVEQMTLITVFVLIAHNLPQEGIIQARSGIPFIKTTLARLAAAVLSCLAVAWCLQPEAGPLAGSAAVGGYGAEPFGAFLLTWAAEMLGLGLKILLIIVGVMLAIEFMKAFDLIDLCVRLFAPFLKMMGLDQRAGLLWLTGVLFGLAYGGAIIVEESRELRLTPEEVEKLQVSIGINHSMIEDPLLFLPFGINPIWLWVPRLAAAVAAVYLMSGWFRLRRAFAPVKTP
ncbi:MAG: iron transporter [Desulfobacterales bacterium]|nr:iron transporter [Desulfobacterales bacterium]